MRSKLALAFVVVGALLTMGAKLSEVPIEDFSSVAGTWQGITTWHASSAVWSERMTIVINEDGSYKEDNPFTPSEGVMRIVDGKIEYDSYQGRVVTVTLHEGNGKRMLKGERQDRERAFKVKPLKKKRKKKKKQKTEKKEY